MIAEPLDEDVATFDAANSVVYENADLADGPICGLLGVGELRMGILLALAGFASRNSDLVTGVVLLDSQIAQSDPYLQIRKPIWFWR